MSRPLTLEEVSEKVLATSEIKEVMEEFAGNMGFKLEGLPSYGMRKVVRYAVVVAYATMLGLPLDFFRMTPEDIAEHQRKLIEAAERAGVPTLVIIEEKPE